MSTAQQTIVRCRCGYELTNLRSFPDNQTGTAFSYGALRGLRTDRGRPGGSRAGSDAMSRKILQARTEQALVVMTLSTATPYRLLRPRAFPDVRVDHPRGQRDRAVPSVSRTTSAAHQSLST